MGPDDRVGGFNVNRLPWMRGGRVEDALAAQRERIVRRVPRVQVDRTQEQHEAQ